MNKTEPSDYRNVMDALGGVDKALASLYFMDQFKNVSGHLEVIANVLQDAILEMEDKASTAYRRG